MLSDLAHLERKRPRKDDDEDPGSVETCPVCTTADITAPQPYFTLGCRGECKVCAVCFAQIATKQHFNHDFVCPTCDNAFTTIETVQFKKNINERNEITYSQDESQQLQLPHVELSHDPVRFHESMAAVGREGDDFVSLTLTHCKEREVAVESTMFHVKHDCNDLSGDQLQVLEQVGSTLHGLLIGNDEYRRDRDFHPNSRDPKSDPSVETWRNMAVNDYSPLYRFVHSLAAGEPLQDGQERIIREKDANWEMYCQTTFAATDIIRNVRSRNLGLVKTTVTNLLKAFGADKAVYKILNAIGVSAAYETARRGQKKQFAEELRSHGVDENRTKHDYAGLAFDNIGYKTGGKKVGYLQFVLLFWLFLCAKKDLMPMNAYPRPGGSAQVLGRQQKKWAEERKKEGVTYETVIAPTKEDYNRLAFVHLSIIDTLLKMVCAGEMPTYEQAGSMCENNNYEWIYVVDDYYGKLLSDGVQVLPGGDEEETPENDDGGGEETQVDRTTHLDRNRAVSDAAMVENLSKLKAVKRLQQLGHDASDQIKNRPSAPGLEQVTPVMDDVDPLLACDGQPAEQLLREMTRNPTTNPVIVLSGGFHTLLAAFKALGLLFGFCFLRAVFGCWRLTQGKLDWVLNDPGDPNQIAEESILVHYAFFVAAIFGYIETHEFDEFLRMTPVDIYDHILKRAKEYPTVFSHVTMLPLLGMILMLTDSEANADAEEYFAAMRLLWPVFCSAHKTGYIFIIEKFFVTWWCASDLEKEIFKKMMFRVTRYGSFIFIDRWVEHGVRFMRMLTGKKATGQHEHFENTVRESAMLLLNRLRAKATVKSEKGGAKENYDQYEDTEAGRKSKKLDKAFLEAFLYYMDLNLFGKGAPKKVPSKPYKTRHSADNAPSTWSRVSTDPAELYDPTGEEHLNEMFLFYFSEGLERGEKCFTEFEINTDINSLDRPEDVVSFRLVEPSKTGQAVAEADRIERWVSTDEEFLMRRGLISAKELKADLKKLNESLPADEQVTAQKTQKGNDKKAFLVTAVIAAREKLIEKDGDWAEKRKGSLQSGGAVPVSYEVQRDLELELRVYSFAGTKAREDFSKEEHVHIYRAQREEGQEVMAPLEPAAMDVGAPEQAGLSQDSAMSSQSTGGWGYGAFKGEF